MCLLFREEGSSNAVDLGKEQDYELVYEKATLGHDSSKTD